MELSSIVEFWRGAQIKKDGNWAHELDHAIFAANRHSFNLDFPVSPFIGDILNAPVLILSSNARYNATTTPLEFRDSSAIQAYLGRVSQPSNADWSTLASYYKKNTNYGNLIATGRAALINVCAYRSPMLSTEPENKKSLELLPSVAYARRWLHEAMLPLCRSQSRFIVVKRGRNLWGLPITLAVEENVIVDPAPISPSITGGPFAKLQEFLSSGSWRVPTGVNPDCHRP